MITKMNKTIIAPAYTLTCATAMNGAFNNKKNTATVAKFNTRNRAE
jgi:hypothetical protein